MRIIGLASLLFLSSLAIGQTINPDQIRPATSDNQVLTTVTANTPPVWAAGGGSGCTTDCVITDPSTSNRPPDGDQTIVQPSGSMFTLQDSALNGQTFTPTGASGCGIDSLIGCPEFYTQLSQDGSFTSADYNCSFDYQFFGHDIVCNDTEDGYKISYFLEGDTFTVSGGEFDGHAGGSINYDPEDGFKFDSMPGFIVNTLDDFPFGLTAGNSGVAIGPYIEYFQANDLTPSTVMTWSASTNAVNNVSGGTITLPPLSSAPNVSADRGVYQFFFNQTTSSATTLTAAAGDTINYGSTFSLSTQGQAVELIGDSFAGNWAVVGAGTGSGSGGSVGTAGQLQMVGSTAGSFAASAATDNGTIFTIGEPTQFTDTACPTCAGAIALQQGTATAAPANNVQFLAPSSVTAYSIELPGVQPSGSDTFLSCTAANPAICSWAAGGGSGGFPITLGSTSIAASSTTTSVAGLSVNGVTLNAAGSSTLFLNQAGGYTAPSGTALTIQTNTTNNTLQTTLNMETSTANSVGLTVTPSNPSGGIEKFEITGSSYTGNAATATNLASYPTLCSGGQFSQGLSSGSNNCGTPSGSGTVTSVSFTGGLISVASPTSTPAFTVAGTSGGLPYFSSTSTWASSALLPTGDFVLGGGSGGAPTATFSVVPVANGGTAASTFAAHEWFGNNTGSTAAPAVSLIGTQDVSPNQYVTGGGTAQAQTATLAPAATSLVAGLEVFWLPTAANTAAAPTLAVNGLTAKSITKLGTTALVANDLTTTAIADAIYDGTEWQLQNPQTASGSPSLVFPLTVSGTTTSGGIPYFSSTTALTSSGILNTGFLVKGGGAGGAPTNSLCDEGHTTANVLTCTDTGGLALTGTAQTMLSLSGTSTGGTQLTLNNSNSGAHTFDIFTSGSGQGVGYLDLYDATNGGLMTAFQCPTSSLCTETGIGKFVRGWQTGSVLNGTIDTGESRDSAGVVDFGNGAYQDKSGTINAAVVNAYSFNGGNGAVRLGKSQLTSTYTNATATPSTIWSFAVAISTNYQITCTGIYKTASGGAFELTVTGPTATNASYSFRPTVGLTSNVPSDLVYAATGTSYPSGINATAVTTAATDMPFIIEFNLNSGGNGTLAIQGNTISTDTLTVETGSTCTIN